MSYRLEIHHINVRGGDATAIAVVNESDGSFVFKVLIDAGSSGGGSIRLGEYLDTQFPSATDEPSKLKPREFDYIVATHYHDDHIKGFAEQQITGKKILDIGGYMISNQPAVVPENGIAPKNFPAYLKRYARHVNDMIKEQRAEHVAIPFIKAKLTTERQPLKIDLGAGTGIALTCYCANGIVANNARGSADNTSNNVLAVQQKTKRREANPNDFSLAFLLEWPAQKFTYFLSGDLSGDVSLQSYYNIEETLIKHLTTNGPLKGRALTVLKVPHHGSERSSYHSDSGGFLAITKPETMIISCNTMKQVPHHDFLTRLVDYATKTNNATVLFLNDLNDGKKVKRYPLLDQLNTQLNKASPNCNLVEKDARLQCLDVQAVVVQVPAGNAGILPGDDYTIDKTTYRLIVKKGQMAEGTTSRGDEGFTFKDIEPLSQSRFTLEELLANISLAFNKQAAEIVNWLDEDRGQRQTRGKNFAEQAFPEFAEMIADALKHTSLDSKGLKAALVNRTVELFDEKFKKLTTYGIKLQVLGIDQPVPKSSVEAKLIVASQQDKLYFKYFEIANSKAKEFSEDDIKKEKRDKVTELKTFLKERWGKKLNDLSKQIVIESSCQLLGITIASTRTLYKPTSQEMDDDSEATLVHMLYNNKYQVLLNQVWAIDLRHYWNAGNLPYTSIETPEPTPEALNKKRESFTKPDKRQVRRKILSDGTTWSGADDSM